MKRATPTSIAEHLSAIGEPIRLRILRLTEREELSVGEIGKVVQLPQSTVSRHLKALADGGWLSRRSEGPATLYRLLMDDLGLACRAVWTALREQLQHDSLAGELAEDERRLAVVLSERRADSQAFFGRVAGHWDELRNELFGSRFTAVALLGLIRPDAVIADIGCGTGNASELLAPLVRRVIAIDASEPMLAAARMRLGAAGRDNVEFLAATVEELPLENASVDAAVCILVLHHVADPAAACRELRRVLKPGGTALIVDMVEHDRAEYRQTMGHRWLGFSRQSMVSHLEGAGLEGVRYLPLATDSQSRGPGLFSAIASAPEAGRATFSDGVEK